MDGPQHPGLCPRRAARCGRVPGFQRRTRRHRQHLGRAGQLVRPLRGRLAVAQQHRSLEIGRHLDGHRHAERERADDRPLRRPDRQWRSEDHADQPERPAHDRSRGRGSAHGRRRRDPDRQPHDPGRSDPAGRPGLSEHAVAVHRLGRRARNGWNRGNDGDGRQADRARQRQHRLARSTRPAASWRCRPTTSSRPVSSRPRWARST